MRAFRIRYECDQCGKGHMKLVVQEDGSVMVSGNNPIKYWHECSKCGHTAYLEGKFPRMEYME